MKEITEAEFQRHLDTGRLSDPASKTITRDPTVIYRRGMVSECAGWVFDCYASNRTQERWVRADKWKDWNDRASRATRTTKQKRAEQKQKLLRPSFGFMMEVKRYLALGMTTDKIAELVNKPESEVIAAKNIMNRNFSSQPQNQNKA